MPFFTGPMPAVLVAGVLIVALLLWIVRDRRHPGPRLEGADGIDREELEAAEREVRELEAGLGPDEERPGDDWGPGTGRPRPPTRL
ncbi:MAG TPA: hypothetical protein VG500_15065 [Gemmatimonadales bacterium]|jgi:hypothetical protein|nr:hypothetical protein [Gemmatimonadales bacterium]